MASCGGSVAEAKAAVRLTGLRVALGQAPVTVPELEQALVRVEALPQGSTENLEAIPVFLTCTERRKVRRRLQLPDGPEIGLALPTGSVLEIGVVLYRDEARTWVVAAALETVAVVRVKDWVEAARVAHAVGNLHRDIDPQPDGLLVLWDGAIELLLTRLEVEFEKAQRPFLGKPSWEH